MNLPMNGSVAPPPGGPPRSTPPQYGALAALSQCTVVAPQYLNRNNAVEGEEAGQVKAKLIVGIDFGTTFSSVAYAFTTNAKAKEDIITEWLAVGSCTKQKIPTVLYYDQCSKVVGWGSDVADALAPTGYPKPAVQKVEWFKLRLMLSSNTYVDPLNIPPLPPGKSEIDVAADYLFKLQQAIRSALQKSLGEVSHREERNIWYYLTVPAIWSDAGKAATRAAAIQAGFLCDKNDNRLTLVNEAEAAVLFFSKTGFLNLKVHDAVLIVDCGSGTVDLIAYEVEEENPFTVAECVAGSGDSCGSTTLNRNFSSMLRTKMRKMRSLLAESNIPRALYAKCIMDFENRIKMDFRNSNQKWAVDLGIEAEFPEAGIEEGCMTFTSEEILQCFEPVVSRIVELVRNQIVAIQAQNRTLQNVLVVGGFGASEYLFQQIKLHVPPQFQAKVVRPTDSAAAIAKGAVIAGVTKRVIASRVSRRHYMIASLQPFKEGHHPEAYRVPSLDEDRCKFTHQILVRKGQRVKIGEPVKVSLFRQVAPGETLMYEDILYACDEDVCPEYTKDPRKAPQFLPCRSPR